MHRLQYCFFILLFCSFIACASTEEETADTAKAPAEPGISYPDSTNGQLKQLLKSYYAVKDALVKSDSVAVQSLAGELNSFVLSLHISSATSADKSSQSGVAQYVEVLQSSSAAIHQTSSLESQREVFEILSDNLYELINTLKPAGMEIYQQYCPMAFNDKGASWLSDTAHIQNPYFGRKMLTCGEVRQTLRYQ
jgi:hypothetical protein